MLSLVLWAISGWLLYRVFFEAVRLVRWRVTSLLSVLICLLPHGVDARGRMVRVSPALLAEGSPTLAPFQHVRFCIRYPADCKSNPGQDERIDLTDQTSDLLNRVNRMVNMTIIPLYKTYGADLGERWTIAPAAGDCNDYAVTKRHELLRRGLPAGALRLGVVKTRAGLGHMVLLVVTTKGELVLDNLTRAIRPWQDTDYVWLKIQSARDARLWFEVKPSGASPLHAHGRLHLADRE